MKYGKKLRNRGFIAKYTFDDIVGVSNAIKKTVKVTKKIAKNDLTVLIQGENGTGKELFAQAIHNTYPKEWTICCSKLCCLT